MRVDLYKPPAFSVATMHKLRKCKGERILVQRCNSRGLVCGMFTNTGFMGGYIVAIKWDDGRRVSADSINEGFRVLGPLEQLAEAAE